MVQKYGIHRPKTEVTKKAGVTKPNISKRSVSLKKADKEMTNTLAPYRKKIKEYEDLKNTAPYRSDVGILYGTWNWNKKKANKGIEKTTRQMEKKKNKMLNDRARAKANGQKLLRTTRA